MSQPTDQDRVKARIAELEAELSELRVSQWVSDIDSQDGNSQVDLTNFDSMSSFSKLVFPILDIEDFFPGRRAQETQAEPAGPASIADSTTEYSVKFRDEDSVHSQATETAYHTADDTISQHASHEAHASSTSNVVEENEGLIVAQGNEGLLVVEANSPMNTDNPHPTLSISIEYIHKAIIDSRKPGSHFVRSILRRERIDNDTSIFYWPESLFLGGVYTDWKWIPFLIYGDSAAPISTNIREGDIELICIKDSVFTAHIQNGAPMFEQPQRLLKKSVLVEELEPDFEDPERWGFRVLAWKVHSSEKTFYMDREGHPVPGPLGMLPWQQTQIED